MTCTTSEFLLCLWIACVLSLVSGALPGNDIAEKDGNWSSVSPSGCKLTDTSLGIRAICTHLGLRSVPQDLPNNTTLLDLSINLITILHNESFTYLPDIITLALRRNRISVIEDGAFEHLGNLKQLILENNRLRSLPAGLLSSNRLLLVFLLSSNNLTSLTRLDLRDNEISAIPGDLLQSQPRLGVFYISNNRLDSIPKTLFKRIPSLQHLFMQCNRITTIEPGTVFPTNKTISLVTSKNYKLNLWLREQPCATASANPFSVSNFYSELLANSSNTKLPVVRSPMGE
eukprot:XP_011663939.1 PREDICTED: decorin-like [Strongylocentrotus purpuratus]